MTHKPPSRSSRDEHESGRADEQPDHHAAGHQAIRPGASAGPSEGQSMYQVGYCRPPLHSRFKPGQSGNPKGRLKQSRNLRSIQAARLCAWASPSAPQSLAQLFPRNGQGGHGMARRRLCRRPTSAGTGDGCPDCRSGEMESTSQHVQEGAGEECERLLVGHSFRGKKAGGPQRQSTIGGKEVISPRVRQWAQIQPSVPGTSRPTGLTVGCNRRRKTERANAGRDLPDLFFRVCACVPWMGSDLVDRYDHVSVRHDMLACRSHARTRHGSRHQSAALGKRSAYNDARSPHIFPLRIAAQVAPSEATPGFEPAHRYQLQSITPSEVGASRPSPPRLQDQPSEGTPCRSTISRP